MCWPVSSTASALMDDACNGHCCLASAAAPVAFLERLRVVSCVRLPRGFSAFPFAVYALTPLRFPTERDGTASRARKPPLVTRSPRVASFMEVRAKYAPFSARTLGPYESVAYVMRRSAYGRTLVAPWVRAKAEKVRGVLSEFVVKRTV